MCIKFLHSHSFIIADVQNQICAILIKLLSNAEEQSSLE